VSESDSESTESVSKVQEVGKEGGQHAQSSRPPDESTEYRGRGRGDRNK
jgi:hypothetical protein